MPVVINEIEIAVEVNSGNQNSGSGSSPISASDKQQIIKECIEQVLEIIKQKTER